MGSSTPETGTSSGISSGSPAGSPGTQVNRSRNRLTSVRNAARILKSFTPSQSTWGVSELARHLDLSTSSTHRLLSTLADEAVLEQDPESGRYRLGLSVFDLAAAAPSQQTLHGAVLVSMTELRSRTGETVQVGVLDGREVVYVERLDSPNTLRVFSELGRRAHAHCTSSGKALLAFSPRDQRERILRGWELPARTEHTITDLDELRRDLDRARRQGYAENRHESEPGVVSIAAPIRDAGGGVVASISLAGPSERMDPNHQTYTKAVMAFARTTSIRLGWSP